jgi:adenosylcobinamide-GDP ribazoletransferase
MFGFQPFLIALQFLSVLPIRSDEPLAPTAIGRSLLYYPLIGLLFGTLLALLAWALNDAPAQVSAVILVGVWVALTGALHLDGLADSADAWIGGLGDRDKTLTIMKDPYCGPMAVVVLVILLLIKFTALAQLVSSANWEFIIVIPVLGRTALVLLFLTTPYVRPSGLGSLLAHHLPRHGCVVAIVLTIIAISAFIGLDALWLFTVVISVFFLLRRLMLRRLGGTTGDSAGALVEITEAAALLAAALLF